MFELFCRCEIPFQGTKCSDYKVRYCCVRQQPAQWGKWNRWSKCSKSCGGGTRKRNRVCVEKTGNKETCFGNFIDKNEQGKDKHVDLKKQEHKCNEISCPGEKNLFSFADNSAVWLDFHAETPRPFEDGVTAVAAAWLA